MLKYGITEFKLLKTSNIDNDALTMRKPIPPSLAGTDASVYC